MRRKIQAVLDESEAAVILVKDKHDGVSAVLHGEVMELVLLMGKAMVDMSQQTGLELKILGNMLNTAVETVLEVDNNG